MKNNKPRIQLSIGDKEWKKTILGEISEIKTGPFGSALHAKDYVVSGTPIITTEHFKNGELPPYMAELPQVSNEDYERLGSYRLKHGDLVFSRVGSVDINALVTEVQNGWLFSGRVLRVRPIGNIDGSYLHYLLDTTLVKNDILSRAVGQTMPSINTEILKNTQINLSTDVQEQVQIGSLFKSLDETISLHQQELEALKQTKQGFLQKMFPKDGESVPEIRFPVFNDEWKLKKLKEIAEINPKSTLPSEFEYVDLGSVVGTRLLSSRKETKQTAPSRAQRVAKTGDVFYQTVRPYQQNNFLFDLTSDNFVFSTGYAQMRPNIDSYFLLNSLQVKSFVVAVMNSCTGTSYPAINSSDLSQLEIMVPVTGEEQIKIGEFFRQLDEVIELKEKEIEGLKETKKGFLQKMFV